MHDGEPSYEWSRNAGIRISETTNKAGDNRLDEMNQRLYLDDAAEYGDTGTGVLAGECEAASSRPETGILARRLEIMMMCAFENIFVHGAIEVGYPEIGWYRL